MAEELCDRDAEEGGEELAEEGVARLREGGFDCVEFEDYGCALCGEGMLVGVC